MFYYEILVLSDNLLYLEFEIAIEKIKYLES